MPGMAENPYESPRGCVRRPLAGSRTRSRWLIGFAIGLAAGIALGVLILGVVAVVNLLSDGWFFHDTYFQLGPAPR